MNNTIEYWYIHLISFPRRENLELELIGQQNGQTIREKITSIAGRDDAMAFINSYKLGKPHPQWLHRLGATKRKEVQNFLDGSNWVSKQGLYAFGIQSWLPIITE